jgi:hypothetical protein
LTVRGRSASLRPTSPTSSRSRVRRIRRAPSSPRASSLLAGEDAIFSNIINYSIAVRRVTVVTARSFSRKIQRGVCKLPGGRELSLNVNDEKGTSTPEGDVRGQAGIYTGRVLKGAKQLICRWYRERNLSSSSNLKTAKAPGLSVPIGLLNAADEVIE